MKYKVIASSFFFGVLLWVIDAAVDATFFHEFSFLDSLIFRITPNEFYMRMIMVIYFLIIGWIVSVIMSKQRHAEKALKESEKMSRILLEAAPEGIIVVDSNGVINLVNSSTELMTGYTRDELIGQKIETAVPELLRDTHREYRTNYMSNPASRPMGAGRDLQCQRKDGSVFPVEIGLNYIETKKGIFVIALLTDITERKKAEKELQEAARTDSLTGLSNRRDFIEKFNFEISRFKRNNKPFSIVMGDIDYFKKINDTYGHVCGDTVLQKIAALMRASLRHQDSVGRWGGEEFIILLPETGLQGGVQSTEKIRRRIQSEQFDHDGKSFTVTMSFGVSLYDHSLPMEKIIKTADERLYKAKAAGRNRVVADE